MLKLPLALPIAAAILTNIACQGSDTPANPSAVAQRQTVDVQLEELKRSQFCTDAAEKFWARHDWKNQHDLQNIVTYTSHYNKTLNKCLVDVHGGVKSGRVEMEKDYADEFDGVYKNAMLKDESNKVRFLTADVAILDADHAITGRADGTIKNHVTAIYVKRNGNWALVAYRVIRMQ